MQILTIAIPTYNRVNLLSVQLRKLSEICSDQIKIIVGDNGSTDGTNKFLSNQYSDNPHITFYINESNLGFDENIKKLYMQSASLFVWFLSDDDEIVVDRVLEIVEILQQNSDLGIMVLLRDRVVNHKLVTHQVTYANKGRKIEIESDLKQAISDTQVNLRACLGTLVGQISTCIVSKHDKVNLDFDGGGIAHVLIVHQVLEKRPKFYLCSTEVLLPGSKDEISDWFMWSCLQGVELAYESLNTIIGNRNVNLVVSATRLLGLRIALISIIQRKNRFNADRILKHIDFLNGKYAFRMRMYIMLFKLIFYVPGLIRPSRLLLSLIIKLKGKTILLRSQILKGRK